MAGIAGLVANRFRRKDRAPAGATVVVEVKTQDPAAQVQAHQLEAPASEPTSVRRIASVSYGEIISAIQEAPPLQAASVGARYTGLTVEWEGRLFSADPGDGGRVKLALELKDVFGAMVFCEVEASVYPELAILPKGARLRVRGEIENADELWVRLADVELAILAEPFGDDAV